MNEDKVRRATEVANELVDLTKLPERAGEAMWLRVFDAMLYEPYCDNRTATGMELSSTATPQIMYDRDIVKTEEK